MKMITKVKYDQTSKPGMVLARVWMGKPGDTFRLCGTLMFTQEEFNSFTRLLKDGQLLGAGTLILCDEADGSSRNLPKVKP